jgi:hypothetical protein
MTLNVAEFWADTINKLLANRRVVVIHALKREDWKPRSRVVVLTHAETVGLQDGGGFFYVLSSYGPWEGFEEIEINPSDREIIMWHATLGAWRVLRDLEDVTDSVQHAWFEAYRISKELQPKGGA